jgi:hypothetical protein
MERVVRDLSGIILALLVGWWLIESAVETAVERALKKDRETQREDAKREARIAAAKAQFGVN